MKKADLKKRVASFALAGAVFATSVVSGNVFADTKDSSKIIIEDLSTTASLSTATDYGLVDNVQDGVILHCWNWSYSNISANMEAIAEAGYSAVQTSPIQAAKESTTGKSVGSNWWVYYQPAGFWIDNSGKSALGNKAEFKAMCDKAEQYGIKVIVDVVANHVGNKTSNNFADTVDPEIKDNKEMVHTVTDNSNYSTRYENTQKCICSCPDLNTGNSKIQNKVLSFLKECIDAGADGFRFDAAKHIETPEEKGDFASQFWPTVINGAKEYYKKKTSGNLYCYGEILDNLASSGDMPDVTAYTKYMSVTANGSSNSVMQAVGRSNASDAANSNISLADKPSKAVLWAESHDTWANDDGYLSREYTITKVQRAWAMIGSRADAAALYFARPTTETISVSTKLKDSSAATSVKLGAAKDTGWKDKQVVAVNHFHNYFVGAKEYLGSSDGVAFNMRYSETDGRYGVVLCHVSGGSKTLSDFEVKKVADGTYTDEITGNTFTVSGGKLSGKIGDTGIAVVYNAKTSPTPTISQAGGKFKTESVSVTFGLKNAASGTYKIGNSAAVTYTKDTTIEIGKELNVGESVTITLTATDGNTTSAEKTYTFTKADPAQVYTVYCKKPSGWTGELYCYAYDGSVKNAAWPGEKMTKGTDGIYYYQIPDTIEEPNIIFYAGSDSMRYPASQEPGLVMTETKMIYDGSTWKKYNGGQDETTSQGQTTTPVASGNVLYVARPDGWNSLYAYVYDDSTTSTVENAKWPGVKLTLDSKTGYYKYVIPENIKAPKVIITDNAGNQVPGEKKPGLALTGTMLLKDGKLSKYEIPVETTTGETTTGETTSETTTGETTSETTTGETTSETTTGETSTQETTSLVLETTTAETTTFGVTSSSDETTTQETTSPVLETTTAETTTFGVTSSSDETTTQETTSLLRETTTAETTSSIETTTSEKETTLKDETTKTEKETTTLKDETTKKETTAEETTTIKKDNIIKITGFTASKKSGKVVTGQGIVLRVKAEKATSYKFTVKKKGGKETIIKPYSSKTKCSWRAAVSGTYTFKVYAKNSNKVVTKTITNFKIGRKLSINSITPSKKSKTAKTRKNINIKVKVNGGIGTKYYKYYYILDGKKTDISKYVTKSSISWKPKKAGTYTLCVTVKDDAGNKCTGKISRYVVVK